MAHSLRFVVNCSILFTELPLLERPRAAKAAGFDAVEFWWPFATATPTSGESDDFVAAVEDAGVRLAALNFAAGDMPGGDRGLLSWPGRESEFSDSVGTAVEIGGRLGTIGFNALYGNRVEGADPAEQDELAATNLAAAAEAAAAIDAVVLLEPVSGTAEYPLKTADDAIAVIDRVQSDSGVDNLRLLADLYHLSVNGDDVDAVLERHLPQIGHVQIADSPGRHEPGTGELPVDRWLRDLQAAGYTGWVGLEYQPSETTEASLSWLPANLRATT